MLSMQTALAQMCVDASFRRLLRRDPDQALRSFDLSVDEAAAVTTIDTEAVDRYAEALVGKRMALIAKWFPLTIAMLKQTTPPDRLQPILNGYAHANIRDSAPVGGDWVRSEFEQFRGYLRGVIARKELAVPYLADVLDFEATRQLMSQDPALSRASLDGADAEKVTRAAAAVAAPWGRPRLGGHVRVLPFDCDIVAVIAQVESGSAGPPVSGEPAWVMFVKKPGLAKVVVQALNPALRDVLELCDGTRTTAEILAVAISRHATEDMPEQAVREDCRAVLEQFCLSGLMTAGSDVVDGASVAV
jgi:hypothetical protein